MTRRDTCWKPPSRANLKLNVDAHLLGDGRWGLGFILRWSDGRPVMVATRTVAGSKDSCMAKALGVYHALNWIEKAGWVNVHINLMQRSLWITSIHNNSLEGIGASWEKLFRKAETHANCVY